MTDDKNPEGDEKAEQAKSEQLIDTFAIAEFEISSEELYEIAFVRDVEQMFSQVVNPSSDNGRNLWREEPEPQQNSRPEA